MRGTWSPWPTRWPTRWPPGTPVTDAWPSWAAAPAPTSAPRTTGWPTRRTSHPSAWGFDLSKAAAATSARRHRDLGFAVADVEARIPLLDSAAGTLMAVFAPRPAAECARVLAPGGELVAAFATPRHLEGLRRRWDLLSVGEGKLATLSERLRPWFTPGESHTVDYEIALTPSDAERLVAMGPNARHGGLPETPAETTRERISVTVARFVRR